MALHLARTEVFTKLTPATISNLAWEDGKSVYVGSLTGNLVLPAPTSMVEDDRLMIYLRGNAGGFVWDLSAYSFGQFNDGTPIVPGQSTAVNLMDRISVHRVGLAFTAVWHRGIAHAEPT